MTCTGNSKITMERMDIEDSNVPVENSGKTKDYHYNSLWDVLGCIWCFFQIVFLFNLVIIAVSFIGLTAMVTFTFVGWALDCIVYETILDFYPRLHNVLFNFANNV